MSTRAELRIARLAPRGDGIAHWQGEVVFVADVAPGDHVEAEILGRRRGVLRARVRRFLARGEQGADPFCPHAGRCGGCALQYVARAHWPRLKGAWVEDAFRPFLHADVAWDGLAHPTGPRRRMIWHGDGARLGFFARASHALVVPDPCPLADARLVALRREAEARGWGGCGRVQAVVLAEGCYLVAERGRPDPVPGVSCWAGRPPAPLNDARMLHERVPAGEDDIAVAIPPGGFVQATAEGLGRLVRLVADWCAGARRVGDLFCGAGVLSLPLAASGAEVVGADADAQAVAAANATARRLGLAARYEARDLFAPGTWLGRYAGLDALIVDPPRKGAQALLMRLGALIPQRLVLIHCDLASAARDARLAAQAGYRLRALAALDLFPGAGHVEAASLWMLGRL